ncbi:MAG: TRAM domain-containing protein [candidate division WOR-3 bacterium]
MLFRKTKAFIIDSDTLADPRVVKFLQLGLLTGRLFLPQPGIQPDESEYSLQRAKEHIEQLKRIPTLKLKILPIKSTDELMNIAQRYHATLITIRSELKHAANGFPVITTAELFELFRPAYLPGTTLRVKISKRGKERNEGIGYLEGGIKVVVENGGNSVGQEVDVIIQGGIDTDVGQVLFAKPKFIELH